MPCIAFGARGAATLLHKLTVFSFVAFIFTTLAIGVVQKSRLGTTVMSGVETSTPAAEEPAEEPAGPAVGALPEALPEEQDATASGDEAAPTPGAPADESGSDG